MKGIFGIWELKRIFVSIEILSKVSKCFWVGIQETSYKENYYFGD